MEQESPWLDSIGPLSESTSSADERIFVRQSRGQAAGVGSESDPVPELLEAARSEKQAEVLRTTYHSGSFDADRNPTGAEIAPSLGIAQPTVSKRLRLGQRDFLALPSNLIPTIRGLSREPDAFACP